MDKRTTGTKTKNRGSIRIWSVLATVLTLAVALVEHVQHSVEPDAVVYDGKGVLYMPAEEKLVPQLEGLRVHPVTDVHIAHLSSVPSSCVEVAVP